MRLLLASENEKKRAELAALLAHLPISVTTPSEVGGLPEVVEDEETFIGNARKKALSASAASGLWSLADDSGLEVDHLGGAPGIQSARYAGIHGDDEANKALLLSNLAGVPEEQRSGRFVCALALARPGGEIAATLEGRVEGRILTEPRGAGGFGYDPLFLFIEEGFPQTGRGFGELAPEQKADVSHRGRALRALLQRLPQLIEGL